MVELKKFSLVKPTISTPFHIDFEWWKTHDNNWKLFLHSCLCPEHQAAFSNSGEDIVIDWIDPKTAEVKSLDGLQHILMSHCAKQENFLSSGFTLVDGVFRVFLSNGNSPLSPSDLEKVVGRPAETILRTLAGPQIYKGLRPCLC
jgi:hypothetical protein